MSKKIHSDQDIAQFKGILGPRIRASRKAMNVTQKEAARCIGISEEFYARVEKGHALPSVRTLKGIAKCFRVSPDYLIGLTDYRSPMPPLKPVKDSRKIIEIVDKARNDPELTRLLLALLKMCEKRDIGR